MTDSSSEFLHHPISQSLTDYPVLGILIQMCSNVSHHRQDVTAGWHGYSLWTENKKIPLTMDSQLKINYELSVNVVNNYHASHSPDHVVPSIQDFAIGQFGWRSDHLGEQQPGPSSVIRLSVWDQVGDEWWRKLVLFGPDGEGPAEISAGDPEQKTISATAVRWSCSKQ